MKDTTLPEVWLRGPIPKIPSLLQPCAMALIQSVEEINVYLEEFPENLLWEKPFGRAAVGFHLKHIAGVINRMLTYAEGKSLEEAQFNYLKKEEIAENTDTLKKLIAAIDDEVGKALKIFEETPNSILSEKRTVGRKKMPSTLIGLYYHAGEHAQRHVGQLLVTRSILENS